MAKRPLWILGLSGGLDPSDRNDFDFPYDFAHDAAAVLLKDGAVVAGIEEERLNRVKHTNKSCAQALRFCLQSQGLSPAELAGYAFYGTEPYCQGLIDTHYRGHPLVQHYPQARELLADRLSVALEHPLDPAKFYFVHHHRAHAASTFYHSGYPRALVLTLDGQGEDVSGMVLQGGPKGLQGLHTWFREDSLGHCYRRVIRFLGYDIFDEYKVMGLAPYGDAAAFRSFFCERLYQLLPQGNYRLFLERVPELAQWLPVRQRGEPFRQGHKDLAAALQEALEVIGLHIVRAYRQETGLRTLCLAGGVAHNCAMNGRILRDGGFDRVFVHPASHDAGCAVGAALELTRQLAPQLTLKPLEHVYWGRDLATEGSLEAELLQFQLGQGIAYRKLEEPCREAARLLAAGEVIGWVQGRSEFGPRALGNRSILADPRPAANKDRINRMIKKREAYRPFAPSVLVERAGEYFELPAGEARFPYMVFVLPVKKAMRTVLGAVTHVDGTARVQTVSRVDNPRYWQLIRDFGEITGVPILLNTSFNDHSEPIVDSAADALNCFFGTELTYLVLGDYLVWKKGA